MVQAEALQQMVDRLQTELISLQAKFTTMRAATNVNQFPSVSATGFNAYQMGTG